MQLSNKVDKRILKESIQNSGIAYRTISFYRYYRIENPQQFRDELFRAWYAMGVVGRIYIASEGINAQLACPETHLEIFKTYLDLFPIFKKIRLNFAVEETTVSFYKLKILVREKIVADGIDDPNFSVDNTAPRLSTKEFNEKLEKEGTIVVDFRNHYESEVGHFKGAILPDVDTFREQLPKVVEQLKGKEDKTILMYCTGGIRCEKASAYMKYQGFKEVYHLEGGIIKYANDCKESEIESKFIGKNFVFDERLGEKVTYDIISNCHQCGKPADTHTNCVNEACHLLFIQCEECKATYENCCSEACQEFIHLDIETQKSLRKGQKMGQNIFKKGRAEHLPFQKKS
ncbi:MAG: rhodanese-related sulfurtransferase [Chitinophagales bacterium]|jgi:UPF0176 protein|nr:rhodanese-related sulfurtransferase [Chitinophagales bacterium]